MSPPTRSFGRAIAPASPAAESEPSRRHRGDPPGRPRNVALRELAAGGVLAFAFGGLVLAALAPGPPNPGASATVPPAPTSSSPTVRPYREGVIGRLSGANPLTARSQVDRDLVALIFRGLVRLGPQGQLVPDLASSFEVDRTGARFTFRLRDDAVWQDGTPVTAEDVLFTIRTIQDPAYRGPFATSWREMRVTAVDERTVVFDLTTPLGGFLQGMTLPLAPAHLLGDIAVEELAADLFGTRPVGSGPFRLEAWSDSMALLRAAWGDTLPVSDALAPPTMLDRAVPYLDGIELRFFADAEALAEAYRQGTLDAAWGLSPDTATELASSADARLLRYPSVTFTGIALNVRPGNDELRDVRVRRALLLAIDRARIIREVWDRGATRADSPIPPSSWAYSASPASVVPFDRTEAARQLRAARWRRTDGGWIAPGASKPFVLELISIDRISNPMAYRTAAAAARDWEAFGLDVRVVPVGPTEFVRNRLRQARFQAALMDINIGLDPDLYPLFASTQVTSSGSNFVGAQIPELDKKLVAARAPGSLDKRRKAYADLQAHLARLQLMLPLFFRDHLLVARPTLSGRATQALGEPSDRFWDVLSWHFDAAQ